jgi:hypothetical protein
MAASHIFRILFVNQGKIYEVYARRVNHGELFGFIEVEELLFGERSSVVLDPSEERIKGEFEGVKRTFLPLHSVLRIDEVKKQGMSKIMALEGGGSPHFDSPSSALASRPSNPGSGDWTRASSISSMSSARSPRPRWGFSSVCSRTARVSRRP